MEVKPSSQDRVRSHKERRTLHYVTLPVLVLQTSVGRTVPTSGSRQWVPWYRTSTYIEKSGFFRERELKKSDVYWVDRITYPTTSTSLLLSVSGFRGLILFFVQEVPEPLPFHTRHLATHRREKKKMTAPLKKKIEEYKISRLMVGRLTKE